MAEEKKILYFKNYIKSQLAKIKDSMSEARYNLYTATVDSIEDYEELKELAELELQIDYVQYVKQNILGKLSEAGVTIGDIKNMAESDKYNEDILNTPIKTSDLEEEQLDKAESNRLSALIALELNKPDAMESELEYIEPDETTGILFDDEEEEDSDEDDDTAYLDILEKDDVSPEDKGDTSTKNIVEASDSSNFLDSKYEMKRISNDSIKKDNSGIDDESYIDFGMDTATKNEGVQIGSENSEKNESQSNSENPEDIDPDDDTLFNGENEEDIVEEDESDPDDDTWFEEEDEGEDFEIDESDSDDEGEEWFEEEDEGEDFEIDESDSDDPDDDSYLFESGEEEEDFDIDDESDNDEEDNWFSDSEEDEEGEGELLFDEGDTDDPDDDSYLFESEEDEENSSDLDIEDEDDEPDPDEPAFLEEDDESDQINGIVIEDEDDEPDPDEPAFLEDEDDKGESTGIIFEDDDEEEYLGSARTIVRASASLGTKPPGVIFKDRGAQRIFDIAGGLTERLFSTVETPKRTKEEEERVKLQKQVAAKKALNNRANRRPI